MLTNLTVEPASLSVTTSISLVTHTAAGGASNVTTPAVNTTSATLLVAVIGWWGSGAAPSLSDSKGNAWVGLTPSASGAVARSQIFYVKNPTVGSSHTFSLSGSGGFSLGVMAFVGTDTTQNADQQNAADSTASPTSLQPGSITPTLSNEVLVSGVTIDGAYSGLGVDSGFNVTDTVPYVNSAAEGLGAAYLLQGAAAAVNPTWAWTTGHDCAASIACFKAPPATASARSVAPVVQQGAVGLRASSF